MFLGRYHACAMYMSPPRESFTLRRNPTLTSTNPQNDPFQNSPILPQL